MGKSVKIMFITILLMFAVIGVMAHLALAVTSDTGPTRVFSPTMQDSFSMSWANITSVTNTTGYRLPIAATHASCEMLVTNSGTTDRIVTLQSSLDGSQWSNVTASHTVTPSDSDTLKFEVVNYGLRWVRFHVVSGTLNTATDIQPTCEFWR